MRFQGILIICQTVNEWMSIDPWMELLMDFDGILWGQEEGLILDVLISRRCKSLAFAHKHINFSTCPTRKAYDLSVLASLEP